MLPPVASRISCRQPHTGFFSVGLLIFGMTRRITSRHSHAHERGRCLIVLTCHRTSSCVGRSWLCRPSLPGWHPGRWRSPVKWMTSHACMFLWRNCNGLIKFSCSAFQVWIQYLDWFRKVSTAKCYIVLFGQFHGAAKQDGWPRLVVARSPARSNDSDSSRTSWRQGSYDDYRHTCCRWMLRPLAWTPASCRLSWGCRRDTRCDQSQRLVRAPAHTWPINRPV